MIRNASQLGTITAPLLVVGSAAVFGNALLPAEPPANEVDWWSQQPLRQPQAPAADGPWVRTPIDAFILETLDHEGLAPTPEADRRTLIRRLTYDLIGLPPTPDEVTAFVSDPGPDAYETLVDRLLESPHYGERWARHWLDVVQYADTCGFDKDKLRPNAWPYRDYVIRSFNEDKPYARFVQEQIAGDVLFPGEPDGIIALGFIAAGPWDFIGHVEVPESKIDGQVARNLDRDNMVANTFNTFCSVTVQCARCHDHKFDPVTQDHYYGMQAIFAAVDRAERPYDLDPAVEMRRQELESSLLRRRADLVSIEQAVTDAAGPRVAELGRRIAELRSQRHVVKDPEFGYHSAIAADAASEKQVTIDLGAAFDVDAIILRPCHDDFAGIGAGFGFPRRFRVEVSTDGEAWGTVTDDTARDAPNPGLSPVEITRTTLGARYVRVTATRLAERSSDYMFALAELEVIDRKGRNVARGAAVASRDSIEAPVRWARANLTDGRWARTADAGLEAQIAKSVTEREDILATVDTSELTARSTAVQQSIRDAEAELQTLPRSRMVYAAATHFEPEGSFRPTEGTLRPIHVLHRGDVQQPREPAVAGAMPLGEGSAWRFDSVSTDGDRRAALARWLTRTDHLLVWRSIVNRVWLHHFGRGIVGTPNDFGRMGDSPTHPALLDWLAAEFRDGGQSFKKLHRLIVTSSVYRQSSRFDEAHAAIDGDNRYLWRMNRRRLDAESLRDSILAVSGAIDPTMGGPGFYLFELERTEHSPHYEYHKFDPADPASHRRSIYRFVVRSQPDPWMTTLDCADSSQSTPARNETLTSLQALSLLNSRFNLTMAERFAERLEHEATDLPGQVDRAMMLVMQRPPSDTERGDLVAYARSHGLSNLCRLLFNLSEFVYVD